MKKKVNVFGKTIPIFVFVLLGIGLVSAALVGYLSGAVTGVFGVTSPMVMTISPDTTAGIHGGESVAYTITVENLASVPIKGETSITVTNPNGVTCEDFSSIMVGMSTPWVIAPVDILLGGTPACWPIEANTIGLMFGPKDDTYDPGRLDTMSVNATLKQNALGTYTFNAQILEPGFT